MKALLVGLGQMGLGLIVPTFKKAGYTIVGTDASQDRLKALQNGYYLETPSEVTSFEIDVARMDEVSGDFDVIVTSVGRQHLEKVATWYQQKKFSAPVLLAENLPDPVNFFPRQIPIVIDRICPRTEMYEGLFAAVAEDYYKIIVLDDPVTHQLGSIDNVELESFKASLENKRRQKMFTVNTSHLLTALFGQRAGCSLVEEAVARPEIVSKIHSIIFEVGPWLGFNSQEAETRANQIIKRFSNPLKDPLSRILVPEKYKSALRYFEVPLNGLYSMGLQAPTLEEARNLLRRAG